MKKSVITLVVFIVLSSFAVQAQGEETKPKAKITDNMSITPALGLLHFYGDIRQYDFYPVTKYNNENKFGFGLSVNKTINNIFGVSGQFLYGSLSGTKRQTNTYFTTNILEGNISLLINVRNLMMRNAPSGKCKKFSTYIKIGHGLARFDSEAKTLNTDDVLSISGKTTEAVTPIGIICNYQLKNNLDLGFNFTYRAANTDKLDAWEAVGSSKDMYSFAGISLTYHLGLGEGEEPIDRKNPFDEILADVNEIKTKVAGLGGDDDNDGVANSFDKDNATPEGHKVYGDGTSVDTDGDGIADANDNELFTPKGSEVDGNGAAIDTDKDGVPDVYDKEPSSKIGTIVNYQGITIGKAYSEGGRLSGQGGGAVKSLPIVYFQSNGSAISYSEIKKIAQVAFTMKANTDMKIMLVGHADETGSAEYNLKLSQKRAEKVKQHLVKYYKIDGGKIQTSSEGEKNPLANKQYNTVNRRVEIKQVL